MRIAIFGLGSIGQRHAANLLDMGETDLRGYDPAKPNMIFGHGAHGLELVGASQEIWDWKPEVALICTPPNDHAHLATVALRNGCHVFLEKPITRLSEHGYSLAVTAERFRKQLAIGYQLRWSVKDFSAIASGDESVLFTCIQDMSSWQSQYQKDMLEEFSHELDAAQYVYGPAEAVMARRYGEYIWNINLRHLRGYSYVRLVADVKHPFRQARSENSKWTFDQTKNDQAYKDELAAFLKACRGEGWDDRLCTGAEAAHVVRIIEACRESARECKVVHI